MLSNIVYAIWKIVLRNLNYLQCLDMVLKAGFMASVQYNPNGKGMMVHSMPRGMNLSIENYSSLIGWANLLKLNFFWTSPQGKPPLKTKTFNFRNFSGLWFLSISFFPMQVLPDPRKNIMPHMTTSFNISSNHNLWGDWKASIARPYSKFYFDFFCQNPIWGSWRSCTHRIKII